MLVARICSSMGAMAKKQSLSSGSAPLYGWARLGAVLVNPSHCLAEVRPLPKRRAPRPLCLGAI